LIKAPNVFTVNSDGINETFQIKGLESYPYTNVIIYNRWGDLIHQSTIYHTNNWDGGNYPEGVYFFVVEYGENEENKKNHTGVIHLLR
jgi:gliding motility-associated-like protein